MNSSTLSGRPTLRAICLGSTVACILGACASTPRVDATLDSSRAAVSAAHADARVKGDANAELGKADAALAKAEAGFTSGAPLPQVDHDAYLADRYARAAVMHGALLASREAIAEQDNRRNAVLLQARDADIAQANAVSRQQSQDASDARAVAAASAAGMADANDRAAALASDLAALQAKQTDRGVVVTLGDVLFATGKSDLRGSSDRSIDTLSTFLKGHPERNVRIEGFTDSVGTEDYNQGLSDRRASAVADALVRRGIDAQRLLTHGYGEAYPVASNDNSTGRQENRRVEVIISDGTGTVAGRTR